MESIKIVNMMAGAYYMPADSNFQTRINALFKKPNEIKIIQPQLKGRSAWNPMGGDEKYSELGISTKYVITYSEENLLLLAEWKKWLVGDTTELPEAIYHHRQLTQKQFRSALFAGITIHHPSFGRMILQPHDNSTLLYNDKKYILLRRVG
jgi:hypothetical protein